MKIIIFTCAFLMCMFVSAGGIPPVVTSVSTPVVDDVADKVTLYYSVTDPDDDELIVSVYMSTNSGVSYDIQLTEFVDGTAGNVGRFVSPGNNKKLVWSAGEEWPDNYSEQVKFRIVAEDDPAFGEFYCDFTSDVFAEAHWTRSDSSANVDIARGVLHVVPDGDQYDNAGAYLSISLSLPTEVIYRSRIVGGSVPLDYRLPALHLYFNSQQHLYTIASGGGWTFDVAPNYTWQNAGIVKLPPSVGVWVTHKIVLSKSAASLYAKFDGEVDFTHVFTRPGIYPDTFDKVWFRQPYDAECELDSIYISRARLADVVDD